MGNVWHGAGEKPARRQRLRTSAPRTAVRRFASGRVGSASVKPLGVVVIDDQPFARMGVKVMVDSQRDMKFLAEAEDLAGALAAVARTRPDVVLVDATLAGANGAAMLRSVLRSVPGARVLALGLRDGDEGIFQMLEAGAAGYVLKTARPREVLLAIREANAGRRYLSAGAEAQLERRGRSPVLTGRQRDVLALLAEGRTNATIAAVLEIAPGTVKLHVKSILAKLGVEDRAEAAVVALRRGFARLS